MNILSLNTRGLGSGVKRSAILKLTLANKIDVLCIQETKKDSIDKKLCQYLWGDSNVSWECLPSINSAGGLLCIWNNDSFLVNRKIVGSGFIMLEGLWVKENKKVIITNVYAPCDLQGKRNQWEEILHLKSSYQNELWCILGDFNSIRNQSERLSSSQNSVNSSSIAEFNSWISLMAVEEVRSIGRKYTWFRPNGSVMSKLDRFFISDSWLIQWPDTTQFVLDRDFSDHCPILLRSNFVDWGPKPFKVMDWWLQDKGFQDMVALKWSNYHPNGWGGFALKQKLKFIKGCIRQWSSSNGVINVKKIQDLKKELNALEAGISDRIMNQSEVDLKKSLQEQLWHASNAYESMLRQKARVKWLKEGDRNSAYFHNMLNHRRRHNAIQGLIIDGEWVQDPSRVKNEALNHFKDRFSEQNFNRPTLDGVLLPSLGQSENEGLQHHQNSLINNLRWKVGNGARIQFWKDIWRGDDITLKDKYPVLYQVSQQQDLTINSMGQHVENGWDWKFQWRRNFFDHEIDMVAAFMDEIDGVQLHLSRMDHLTWRADSSGSYSTKSAYNSLMEDGSSEYEDNASRLMWKLKIPPRAAAFSWKIFKDRLPTKANLRRRQVCLPSYSCPLCDGEEESAGHIMFACSRTRSLWWEALRWADRVGPFPTDPKDHFIQFSSWSSNRCIDNRWAVLWIAISMTIWKHRNSMVFNNQIFDSGKVMDEALFHTWAWLKYMDKDFHIHFNQWSTKDITEKELWYHFRRWGDLREIFIPKQKNKNGRRFGFARFKGVKDAHGLAKAMDQFCTQGIVRDNESPGYNAGEFL
ncbi:putative ribonuclease H protein [Glycine max]|nr:putative ribonuclease H protein [Glycine max]